MSMKLIDADALLKQITEDSRGNEGWFGDTWDFLNTIKNAQTIDAVPVVRCGDCRYGYQFYDVQKGITDSWVECRNPNGLNRDVSEDGYCYCGERKTDDE